MSKDFRQLHNPGPGKKFRLVSLYEDDDELSSDDIALIKTHILKRVKSLRIFPYGIVAITIFIKAREIIVYVLGH